MITSYHDEYREVGAVYFDAVHAIASRYYTPAQIEAWAPVPRDFTRWKVRCENNRPYLFKQDSRVVGFLELDRDGHIGAHYASHGHEDAANGLLDHALAVARGHKTLRALFVEATLPSVSYYLRRGFKVVEAAPAPDLPVHRLPAVRLCKFL